MHVAADVLLSVRDAAARLGVSTATVYTLCDKGEIRHVRVLNAIRIAEGDLAAFVEANSAPAGGGAARRPITPPATQDVPPSDKHGSDS